MIRNFESDVTKPRIAAQERQAGKTVNGKTKKAGRTDCAPTGNFGL